MSTAVPTKIEIVTFTTLYPNSQQPNHGIFVENRLSHLVASQPVTSRVVAPVPWFPFSAPIFGRYSPFAKVVPQEVRSGLTVHHPRYGLLPKVGMSLVPGALFAASVSVLRKLRRERDFDLIDAHYFYPDAIAATWLGR